MARSALLWTLGGLAVLGVVGTGAAVWALTQPPAADDRPTASGVSVPGTEPNVEAPQIAPLYTGDELEWLMPSDEALAATVGLRPSQGIRAEYAHAGESEGISADPHQCTVLLFGWDGGMVGTRSKGFYDQWDSPRWSLSVMQFGDADRALSWFEPYRGLADVCRSFDWGRVAYAYEPEVYSRYELTVPIEEERGRAELLVFTLAEEPVAEWGGGLPRGTFSAIMVHGNTVTQLWVSDHDISSIDAETVARMLEAQSDTAYERLLDAVR